MLLALLALIGGQAFADPVPFRETLRIEGQKISIPMSVSLAATSDTQVLLNIRGDLAPLQAALPTILSQVIEDDCEERTAIAVTRGRADGEEIVLEGQLQHRRWLCPGGRDTFRTELLKQTADVRVRLFGEVVDGCLLMRVRSARIDPDGLTGALLDATGLTEKLTRDLGKRLDKALTEDDNCIDIPPEFQAFETRVTGGGFRDLGEGRIGAVIRGAMEINAENFIRLVHLLGREGRLGELKQLRRRDGGGFAPYTPQSIFQEKKTGASARGGEKRLRGADGFVGDRLSRKHPRDFGDARLRFQGNDAAEGCVVLDGLFDPPMMCPKCGDLWGVRDDKNLLFGCKTGKAAPDSIRRRAAHAAVDLVEDKRETFGLGGQTDLEGKEEPAQFTARSDFRERPRRRARVGGNREGHGVRSVRPGVSRGNLGCENGAIQFQGRQFPGHCCVQVFG